MEIIKKAARFFAEYFIFVVGLLFIFAIGAFYAFLRPEGWVSAVFLLIGLGWMIYLLKYFWEIMDKNKSKEKDNN